MPRSMNKLICISDFGRSSVTIPEQVDCFSEQVVGKLGCPRFAMLVNNAGVIELECKTEKRVSPDEFAPVLSTNLGEPTT